MSHLVMIHDRSGNLIYRGRVAEFSDIDRVIEGLTLDGLFALKFLSGRMILVDRSVFGYAVTEEEKEGEPDVVTKDVVTEEERDAAARTPNAEIVRLAREYAAKWRAHNCAPTVSSDRGADAWEAHNALLVACGVKL